MYTLNLRKKYANKISKSLDKIINQIDLLNNIDNTIVLESNIMSGGAANGAASNNEDCNKPLMTSINNKIDENLMTYNKILGNMQKLITKLKEQTNTNREQNEQITKLQDALTTCRNCKTNYERYLEQVGINVDENNRYMVDAIKKYNADNVDDPINLDPIDIPDALSYIIEERNK